jgi:hypothetical protein
MAAISQTQALPVMLGGLLAAGIMNGLVQPVAGRVIAAQVPARRRSLTARVVGAALR